MELFFQGGNHVLGAVASFLLKKHKKLQLFIRPRGGRGGIPSWGGGLLAPIRGWVQGVLGVGETVLAKKNVGGNWGQIPIYTNGEGGAGGGGTPFDNGTGSAE